MENEMRPLIGISCNFEGRTVSRINERKYDTLSNAYVQAVRKAGGIPVIVPNDLKKDELEELAYRLDGFVISGGGDVDPALYGKGSQRDLCSGIHEERDQTEHDLLDYVLHYTFKPVFGICRGLQMLNVAMGGTLISDLPSAGKNVHSLTHCPREEFSHEIVVKEGSILADILREERRVNSFHHQAIDALAPGLEATAFSKDDEVIEAVEALGDRYILAVQWHPEELIHNECHLALFEKLTEEARKDRV
ncbi:MAG: gamma-glutamyl-gamma-aminobutyrate hydrolase family protein [Erysipelotrichaceae bacterium]|nr:gamma-glutamyl-gamma-aminobutyrate hydrolase family protein [Erysipelotrichaceae bacterium]